MKFAKTILSIILIGAMALSLSAFAFAQTETSAPASQISEQEKGDHRSIDFSPSIPYFDGVYMDFETEEDLENWSFKRLEYDTWGDDNYIYSSPKLKEDGMDLYCCYADNSWLYYHCGIDYTVKPEDEFTIALSPDIFSSYGAGDVDLTLWVNGEFYSYTMGSFWSDTVLSTGPMGVSGKLDGFTVSFRNGYYLQASNITVRYVSIGVDYSEAAGIEVLFTDQMGNRLSGGDVKLSGDSLKGAYVEYDEYYENEKGEYWKLSNGIYTTVAPDAVVNGVPVDPATYEDVAVKYRKITDSKYKWAEGDPKSVTGTAGPDGSLRFTGLSDGVYELTEILPPDGYNIRATSFPVNILWDGENYTYKYEGAAEANGLGRVIVIHCVDETQEITDRDITIKHSLNIANDISMNYLVPASQLAGYVMDSVYVDVTIPTYTDNAYTGSKTEILYPEYRDGYYCFVLEGLTAVQMNDTLTAQLHGTKWGAERRSAEDRYSIATYGMNQLNKPESNASLKTLCANLLRYGAMAQAYKGYRTDAPADEAMTAQQRAYLTDLNGVVFSNNYLELNDEYETGFAWTGKGLNLGTRVGVTFRMEKLDESLSDEAWKVAIRYRNQKGEQITAYAEASEMVKEGNVYSFEFAELAATELRTVIAVTVYGGDDRPISKTMVYSPDTYGNGKTELLGDVCRALFAYSDSAKAFLVG